jgi:hypothetical protein
MAENAFTSAFGSFETCRWTLGMSAYRGDRKSSADSQNGAIDSKQKSLVAQLKAGQGFGQ